MKNRKLNMAMIALVIAAAFVNTSCKKHHQEEDNDISAAEDHALAEHVSNDIVNIGSQATDNSNSNLTNKGINQESELSLCGTVKHDTINHIDSVFFNNSTCIDGRVRNGILIFNYSASTNNAKHYRDPGFSCTVSSNNYVVDGNQVNILNKTILNTTPVGFNPSATNLTWSVNGHIQVTKTDGTLDFSYSKTKTLLNTSDPNVYHGSAVPISWNLAKVGIWGSANGTTVKGVSFTASVTNQLVRDFGGCNISGRHPFIQGSLDFNPGSKPTRHIDFGNGSCDLNATVTINGHTHNITLH
jgi:hypothetical protein